MYSTQYHDTTGSPNTDFRELVANRQQNYILNIFHNQPGLSGYTSSEMYVLILEKKWAKTYEGKTKMEIALDVPRVFINVRRSLSNLLDSGHLAKTNRKRPGVTGTDNVVYILKI